ncbi:MULTISPECIES: 3-hydroxyisobutyrate dehydrogenase [unclassified Microbacterium]|uniref:3-hydroxyisobutyrate dehydrogenase n=1 Tax=unclassified Microbacterium TaxID=2609290 RepID=UPI00214AF62A|nr:MULTISPECIES: 3-hydroxyisobutyrate dehydrogenase [unclassified Microbacterium]MCR2808658.1 3-hydroxyisobutyrate dehydrogenase [Microbacterium sp. zg.B185]WIM18909.1 3-hydroxyisobutyrate dehydrogenase [Microbacterium sp. zg-B185]
MRIAFLGLGHMGLPMAANLAAAGHDVVGFDVVPAATEAARVAALPVADSGQDAVASAEIVITMFPSGRHVIDAYRGSAEAPGLLAVAPAGTLFIDSSTIAVDEAQEAAGLAAAAGHRALDAPVSGGVVGAENATLAFMVGGSERDFEAARPILEAMGRRVVHCGGAGLGQAAKVCNNMILAVSQIAVAEAFVLGERLGLSHQALFDVASNASGQCWALTTNCPVPGPVPSSPANRDYRPGFAGALMNKDLGLAEQAIDLTGVDARMGRLAREIYRDFAAGEGAGQDFSGIIRTIRAEGPQP